MSKYIISHQFRMDIMNHEQYGLRSPEMLDVVLIQTDNPTHIAYSSCVKLIERYFDKFYEKYNLNLIVQVDEERVRENYSVPYAIYQKNQYEEKIFIGWGSIEVYDTALPTYDQYLQK